MKNKNLEILTLIGIPGSGKSTWAKEFVRKNPDWVRVSRDDFRLQLKNSQQCDPKVEDLITTLIDQVIINSLSKKLNVIIDNTNCRLKYINAIIEKYKYDADINYRIFDISVDKAIERDNSREMKVGEVVIKKMYENFKILMNSFDFQPVKKVKQRPVIKPNFKSELPNAVIWDVDGTLALMKDRGPFEWDKVYKDDLNEIVSEHIEFHKSKGRIIIIVSGRDASCRKITEEWLKLHEISYHLLYMRPENDFRKDTIIKKEIYHNEIEEKFNVLAVYDDRLQVLKAWNELELFTFSVNQGMVEF